MDCLKEKRRTDNDSLQKRSQPLLLGKNMVEQLQLYLQKEREQGGIVTTSAVVATARVILLSSDHDHMQLAEFGGHIILNRQWTYHLLGQIMKESRYSKK